jgi:hypothetical protein
MQSLNVIKLFLKGKPIGTKVRGKANTVNEQ